MAAWRHGGTKYIEAGPFNHMLITVPVDYAKAITSGTHELPIDFVST